MTTDIQQGIQRLKMERKVVTEKERLDGKAAGAQWAATEANFETLRDFVAKFPEELDEEYWNLDEVPWEGISDEKPSCDFLHGFVQGAQEVFDSVMAE